MKTTAFIFYIVCIILFPMNPVQGQILKKLKDKVQQAAEESVLSKLGEKVGQETDKQMDSLLNIDPDYEAQTSEKLGKLFSGSSVPVADQYIFDNRAVYDVESIHKKEKTSMENTFWFSKDAHYFGSEIKLKDTNQPNELNAIFTIIDEDHQAILLIMEEQKIVQTMSMQSISDLAYDESQINGTMDIKRTGKTKSILGYACEEFVSVSPDVRTSMWITQELELFKKNMFYNLNKSLGANKINIPNEAKGMLMEMTVEGLGKNNLGDVTKMTVKQLDKQDKNVVLKNYQRMNLGNLMNH